MCIRDRFEDVVDVDAVRRVRRLPDLDERRSIPVAERFVDEEDPAEAPPQPVRRSRPKRRPYRAIPAAPRSPRLPRVPTSVHFGLRCRPPILCEQLPPGDRSRGVEPDGPLGGRLDLLAAVEQRERFAAAPRPEQVGRCLLYTSDAADE